MARYELLFQPSVRKDLRGLPKDDVRRILSKVETLRDDPYQVGSERLVGQDRYRIRQGNYRILYTVDDGRVLVEVVKIGHRKDVYRD